MRKDRDVSLDHLRDRELEDDLELGDEDELVDLEDDPEYSELTLDGPQTEYVPEKDPLADIWQEEDGEPE